MDLQDWIVLAGGAGFSLVFYFLGEVAAGLFRRAQLQRMVRTMAVFPFVMTVMVVGARQLNLIQENAPWVQEYQGPVTGQGAVRNSATFAVEELEEKQLRVSFSPAPWQTVPNPMRVKVEITGPGGAKVFAYEQEDTVTDGGPPRKIEQRFEPKEMGEHTLTLELPPGVNMAKAEIR
jgi:hypothetical protein